MQIIYLLILLIASPILAQDNEEYVTVKRSDHFFLDAADNNVYGIRPFKDHFYAKWLEAWQHVVLSQQLQASLNMCVAEANGERPCLDAGDFKDGGGGAVWKNLGDRKGTCSTVAVALLPAEYNGKVDNNSVEILDSNFNKIDTTRFKGNTNPNRPTYCTTKAGSRYLPGPIYVRYTSNGVKECRIVYNPSIRED